MSEKSSFEIKTEKDIDKKSGGKNERTVFIQNRNQTQNFYGNCEDGI
jgi:hypothetical protein